MKKQIPLKTRVFNVLRNVFKIPFFEKVLVTLTKGKSSRSFWGRFVPNDYSLKSYRTVNREGINYHLDLGDYVDWVIYFGFKDKGHETLLSLCKKGDVMLDIGTNVGMVLFRAAQNVGDGGYVYGFEPDAVNYGRCMRNFSLNSFNNILVTNKGLGDKPGRVSMSTNVDNRGMNRIVSGNNIDNLVSVEITTLDAFIQDKALSRVDVMKIDVEGFELNVLKGAQKTLSHFHPVLFIEVSENNLKEQYTSSAELIKFLEDLDYKIKDAATDEHVNSKMNFADCHFDIICQ